jgi:hypothetical protein
MIQEQIDYFRHLAETCKDIGHGQNDKTGFFSRDLQLIFKEKRKTDTVMFLPVYQGNLRDNRSDNPLDQARVQWSILQKMQTQSEKEMERIAVATKAIALKIVARMRWHQEDDPDHTYCQLLQYFDIDDVEYREEEIYFDDWTGIRVITPLTTPLDLTMNPDDWTSGG